MNGHLEVVKYLVECGVDRAKAANDGSTPLCAASRGNRAPKGCCKKTQNGHNALFRGLPIQGPRRQGRGMGSRCTDPVALSPCKDNILSSGGMTADLSRNATKNE